MKIDEFNQKTSISYLAAARADKSDPADAHSESVSKQHAGSDKVDLSSYMPVVPTSQSQQGVRANRVEAVKAQLASGTYQVSGRAVAEKMLSKLVMRSSDGASV